MDAPRCASSRDAKDRSKVENNVCHASFLVSELESRRTTRISYRTTNCPLLSADRTWNFLTPCIQLPRKNALDGYYSCDLRSIKIKRRSVTNNSF